jgi:peptide/nickel transport system permease protein/oligopeptide transport system permease protein
MIGVVWGMIAAYAGGSVDEFMMRVVDILYSLPNLVFVMLAIGFLEPWVNRWVEHAFPSAVPSTRLVLLIGCLGAISWLNMARIVRGQVLSLRSRPFVLASQALGSSHTRILWRHILPNIAGVIIVYTTLTAPTVMLYESFLSFLGLGVRPPSASLGTLIADGAAQLNSLRIRWWLLVCPATVLTAILLSLNAIGNALREAFDPRSDRR